MGFTPITTAAVVAQVSRSPRQVQLRRFLRGCVVEPFVAEHAHEVGSLLRLAGTDDVVDGHLALVAGAASASVIRTSDVGDLTKLSNALPSPVTVQRI